MVGDKKYKIVGLVTLLLLCWMGYYPVTCSGTVVWSDNFDDGDYDGWTICENAEVNTGSDWSATNNYLQLEEDTWSSFYGIEWGVISYPSNVAYGNWSFDFKANDSAVDVGAFVSFMFMSENITEIVDINDWTCYWVYFDVTSVSEFTVSLREDFTTLETAETNVPVAGWHHVEVTRTAAGLFSVYVNGSLIIEHTDTSIVASEMFAFAGQKGIMIDNIVVDDEPPPEPTPTPTPTPTTTQGLGDIVTLVVIGAAAVVVVVVLVIIVKRR